MAGRRVRTAGLLGIAGLAIGAAPAVPPPLILKCSYTGEIVRSGADRAPSLTRRTEGTRYYRLTFRKSWVTGEGRLPYEAETEAVWLSDPGKWAEERCSNQECEVRATRIRYGYQELGSYVFDDGAAQRPSLQTGEYTIDRGTGAYRFEQKEEAAAAPFTELRFTGPLSASERAPDGAVVTETRTGTCEKSAGPEQDVKF